MKEQKIRTFDDLSRFPPGSKVRMSAKDLDRMIRRAGLKELRFDDIDLSFPAAVRATKAFFTAEELFEMAYGFMQPDEAARVSGVPLREIRRAIRKGQIKSHKVGRIITVEAASLRTFAYCNGYRKLSTGRTRR